MRGALTSETSNENYPRHTMRGQQNPSNLSIKQSIVEVAIAQTMTLSPKNVQSVGPKSKHHLGCTTQPPNTTNSQLPSDKGDDGEGDTAPNPDDTGQYSSEENLKHKIHVIIYNFLALSTVLERSRDVRATAVYELADTV